MVDYIAILVLIWYATQPQAAGFWPLRRSAKEFTVAFREK